MTSTDKNEFEGYFNLIISRNNIMHNSFYFNISEFAGNMQEIIDEGTYKTTMKNVHRIGLKSQFFKSSDLSMLSHGCGVSQYPQFYDRKKTLMSPYTYKRSYTGDKCHHFFAIIMDYCIS